MATRDEKIVVKLGLDAEEVDSVVRAARDGLCDGLSGVAFIVVAVAASRRGDGSEVAVTIRAGVDRDAWPDAPDLEILGTEVAAAVEKYVNGVPREAARDPGN